MLECTFAPQINKSSTAMSYGMRREVDDYETVLQRREKLRRQQLEREAQECTFRPQINPLSQQLFN